MASFLCTLSGWVSLAVLAATLLALIILWRGGSIEKIKLPHLFEVQLGKPIAFRGAGFWLLPGGIVLIVLLGSAGLRFLDYCPNCPGGLPGQTAWIFAGRYEPANDIWSLGPNIEPEEQGVSPHELDIGDWLLTTTELGTVIPGWDETGTQRALESPFEREAMGVTYTCKKLPIGTRLYVARRDARFGEPGKAYVWYRVRLSPIGS